MKKPCPFCDNIRAVACFQQWRHGEPTEFWAVACKACGVQQCTVSYKSAAEAWEAWNTRKCKALEIIQHYFDRTKYIPLAGIRGIARAWLQRNGGRA